MLLDVTEILTRTQIPKPHVLLQIFPPYTLADEFFSFVSSLREIKETFYLCNPAVSYLSTLNRSCQISNKRLTYESIFFVQLLLRIFSGIFGIHAVPLIGSNLNLYASTIRFSQVEVVLRWFLCRIHHCLLSFQPMFFSKFLSHFFI